MKFTKINELQSFVDVTDNDVLSGVDNTDNMTKKVDVGTLGAHINLKPNKRITNIESALYDKGVASGEFINIKDSALAEFQEIKSSINKVQETTTGANLFNVYTKYKEGEIVNLNGLKLTFGNDNVIEIQGTATDISEIHVGGEGEANRIYTSSKDIYLKVFCSNGFNTGTSNSYFTFNQILKDGTKIYSNSIKLPIWEKNVSEKISLNPDLDYIEDARLYIGKDAHFTDYKIKLMISEKDEQYEPYTGGIPSPNPDYPQAINTIKDNWDTISIGKNFFNITAVNSTVDGVTFKINEDKSVTANGTSTNDIRFILSDYFELPEGNYFISGTLTDNPAAKMYYRLNYAEGGSTGDDIPVEGLQAKVKKGDKMQLSIGINNNTKVENLLFKPMVSMDKIPYEPYQFISTPNDTGSSVVDRKDNFTFKWELVYFDKFIPAGKIYVNYGKVTRENPTFEPRLVLIDDSEASVKKIMLQPDGENLIINAKRDCYGYYIESKVNDEATTETATVEFLEIRKPNEFLPGDNIIKKFNAEDGKYWAYLEKNMGKTILNGSEDWKGTNDFYTSFLKNVIGKTPATSKILGYCNYFKVFGYNYKEENNLYFHPNKNLQINNPNGKYYSDVNEWKTWLSTYKPELIYELENKEVIPLAPLDQMNMTYNPETNLFSSIGNIKIEAKYYRDFINTIANLQLGNKTLKAQLEENDKELANHEQRIAALEQKAIAANEEVINNA